MSELTAPPAIARASANPHHSINDLNAAATELVLEHGSLMMREALAHSNSADDADDAYQRSLEVLLTKAPSTDPQVLIPWLRIVVRNEALDIARRRSRHAGVPLDSIDETTDHDADSPEEMAERGETACTGAEALDRLSRDQVHCLLAYAHGHSYGEIAELTGFTARKVTRCVTEGRRAFTLHFAAIESGSECERLEPVLQRIADGDSFAHIEARPHLRNCVGCRATLRAYREAPSRVAVLFPLPLVATMAAAAQPVDAVTGATDQLTAAWASLHDRAHSLALGAQQWFEVGTAKKLGAITAAVAALTAGGVAAHHTGVLGDDDPASSIRSAASPVHGTPPRLFEQVQKQPPAESARRSRRTRNSSDESSNPTTQTPAASPAPSPAPAPQPQEPATTPGGNGDLAP